MQDVNLYVTCAVSGLTGLAMLVGAGLWGWRDWVALKCREIEARSGPAMPSGQAGARIEIADLRERIRKLEAIAAGVEL